MSKRPYNMYQSDESFDIMAELDDLDFDYGTYQKKDYNDLAETDCREENPNIEIPKDPIASQNQKHQGNIKNDRPNIINNQFHSDIYDGSNSSNQMEEKNNFLNGKQDKGKLYSKNYREKKKELVKNLQEQNRFLKQKIDDLSFRLHETQIQLNKLKHAQFNKRLNVQTMKEEYMKEIEEIFQDKEANKEKIKEMEEKFTYLNRLSSNQKMGLLNYYKNEFFEILISNVQFYLLDGIIEGRGLSRQTEKIPPRNIDLDVYEIYKIQTFEDLQLKKIIFPPYAVVEVKKYKQLIQTLYHDFCKVIAQGNLIEKMWEPPNSELRASKVCSQTQNFLKLEIYFEKVRYRKDMRELRDSWFVDQQAESVRKRNKSAKKPKEQ